MNNEETILTCTRTRYVIVEKRVAPTVTAAAAAVVAVARRTRYQEPGNTQNPKTPSAAAEVAVQMAVEAEVPAWCQVAAAWSFQET